MQRLRIGAVLVVSMVLGLGLSSCAKKESGKQVSAGSVVNLQYTLMADNAPVVPDNAPRTMTVKIGEGKLPPLFEKNLIGLSAGAAKAIALKPEEAFGPVRKELIARVPRANLPAGELKEGMLLNGGTYTMKVSKIMEDGSVIVDRNHPLAGKHLLYKVRVASVA